MNNTSKQIGAFLESCIDSTMPSYVGEIFNANKTGESVKFLDNSLHKKDIPVTLEHVGLDYHRGYGKEEDIDENIVKIGKVDKIYKNNNSYYAKITFTGDIEPPLVNENQKWYLSASDDRDNVFEIGLTQNPRRNVTPLKKMSETETESPKGVQRLLNMQLHAKEQELKQGDKSVDSTQITAEQITPELQKLIDLYKKQLAKDAKEKEEKNEEQIRLLKEELEKAKASKNLSNKLISTMWMSQPMRESTDKLPKYCLDAVKKNPLVSRTMERSCNDGLPIYNDMEQTGILGVVEEIEKLQTENVDLNSNDENAPKKRKIDDRLRLAQELNAQRRNL